MSTSSVRIRRIRCSRSPRTSYLDAAYGGPLRACADVFAGGGAHGLDDIVVAGAAADVAFQAVADLVFAGVGVLLSREAAAMIMPGVQ